jgi:hypothetical protein
MQVFNSKRRKLICTDGRLKPSDLRQSSGNLLLLCRNRRTSYRLKRRSCSAYWSNDVGVRQITRCPLLLCWAAEAVSDKGNEYLTLPPTVDEKGVSTPTNWIDDGGLTYPSDSLFVRQSYKDIADMILEEAASRPLRVGHGVMVPTA